jgi:hypothetical protein
MASRTDRLACLGVWAFAASVRLLYLAVARPPFVLYFWKAASSLLQTGSLALDGVKTASLEPLYPLFLMAVRAAVGDDPIVVQAVQALVSAIGAIYLYKLTFALTLNRRAPIAASLLFAIYPLLIRHSVDGTESALLTTLLIGFAYQAVAIQTTAGAAAAGGWLGLVILTRAVALPLLLLAPLAIFLKNSRAAAAMSAAALLVLAPYAARNYALSGALLPARGGINLFIANSSYAPGVIAEYGPDILLPYADARLGAEGLADLPSTPEAEQRRDAAYQRLALAEIREHPAETLRLRVQNVYDFFSPLIVPHRIATEFTTIQLGEHGQSTVENSEARPLLEQLAYTLSYCAVLTLAAVGIYRRRRDLAKDAILWLIVFTFAAVHALYFPTTRYRAPVDFVFLFYAGVGADTLLDRWRRARSTWYERSKVTAA